MAGNAKRWNSRLLFGLLVLAGLVGGASVSPAPAAIAVTCEEDECDSGWWGSEECIPNAGNSTACDAGEGGSCTTVGCTKNLMINTN